MKNNEERKLSIGELLARSFGILMVVLYFLVGTTIIFKAREVPGIPAPYALIFGILLILYGGLRAYKLYRKLLPPANEE